MADFLLRSLVIGLGATAILDFWSLLLSKIFGTPPPNFTMMGRWFLYFMRGRFSHEAIAASPPLPQETPAGWIFHYAVGVVFAAATILIGGAGWTQNPTLLPAMLVGWVTIGLGWFFMLPSMGSGIAGAKTPNPARLRLLSVLGHTVFGLGMFAVAWLIR